MTTEQREFYSQGERMALLAYLGRCGKPETLATERVTAGGRAYLLRVMRRGCDGPVSWEVFAEEAPAGLALLDRDHVPACVAARGHQLWRQHDATVTR